MSSLLELPAELRLQILLAALPLSSAVAPGLSFPTAVLKRVCRQFHEDVNSLGSQYRPTYIIAKPTQLKYLRAGSGIDQIRDVSLHIFSSAKIEDLHHRTPDSENIQAGLVAALLKQWDDLFRSARTTLPKQDLQTISLDMSPVPGCARDHSEAFIAWFVNHSSISDRLFNNDERLLGSIIKSVGTWVQTTAGKQQPLLKVVGTMSHDTQTRMPSVHAEIERYPRWGGLDAVFECTFVSDPKDLKWEHIIEILQHKSEHTPPDHFKEKGRIVMDRLRDGFQQDRPFRALFDKNALRFPNFTRRVMLGMTDMASGVSVDERTYSSLDVLMKNLLHQTAEKIGLRIERVSSPTSDTVAVKRIEIHQDAS